MVPKVFVATLLADRKEYFQRVGPPALLRLTYEPKTVYLNVETERLCSHFRYVVDKLLPQKPDILIDIWSFASEWWEAPAFDQDQARLFPIVMARNMARSAFLASDCTHILYVDADVVPPPDTIERLLEVGRPIVGGKVPGRGCHSGAWYIFGDVQQVAPNLISCTHGTAGLLLLERRVMEVLAWRYGRSVLNENWMSEDPCLAWDARHAGFGPWYIRTDVVAQHVDDPSGPLTPDAVSQF